MQLPLDHVHEALKTAECLYTEAQLQSAFDKMAAQLDFLKEQDPLFLCVMNGGLITIAELLRRLSFPLQYDYIHATRYQADTRGSQIIWRKEPCSTLVNRVVVVVDDILDGGITLASIVSYCKAQLAKKVYTAVMLDKPSGRLLGGVEKADVVGLTIPDRFVFGCGLDYHGYWRNLREIYALDPKFHSKP